MKKYYIFLDTNIIQHTLQHNNKEKLIGLHKHNSDFYNSGNIYILPQVLIELNEFEPYGFDLLKTDYCFVDSFGSKILNDTEEYHLSLSADLLNNISLLLLLKTVNYKEYITDTIICLESISPSTQTELQVIKIKKVLEYFEGITFHQEYGVSNYSQSLAKIIEYTGFGDVMYRGFTYRDKFRSTGNFMYDYKKYQKKGETQKSKVGKDAQVISEMILWMEYLKSFPVNGNIVFLTSDFGLIKEVTKFNNDIIDGKILESEHYRGLSKGYITQLIIMANNLKIIKLNPETMLFETDGQKSNKILEIL